MVDADELLYVFKTTYFPMWKFHMNERPDVLIVKHLNTTCICGQEEVKSVSKLHTHVTQSTHVLWKHSKANVIRSLSWEIIMQNTYIDLSWVVFIYKIAVSLWIGKHICAYLNVFPDSQTHFYILFLFVDHETRIGHNS